MGSAELLTAVTFAVVFLIVFGPYYLFVLRPETASQEMLRQRIKTGGAAVRQRTPGAGLLKDVERFSVIGPLNSLLGASGVIGANLRNIVHMSGVNVTVGQIVIGSGCLALGGYILARMWVPNVLVGMAAGVLLGSIPYAVLLFLRARRLNKFEEQFPEAVDLIARALRAGHAFPTGLSMAADELPQPVAAEFKLLHDQQNYGLPLTDALHALAKRVPLIDAQFFVTAVLTQREAGGNLAEVLDNLSGVIRERFKIKRQLRVVSAHGRLTGTVLAMMPPLLAAFMISRRPDHFEILTTTPAGVRMIIVAIFLQILGGFLIYKITKVEY